MSDQIPYYIKIRPGKQLFAEWEVSTKQSERNSTEALLGGHEGGGSTHHKTFLSADGLDDDDIEAKDAEGLAHLRGEATENQDKFRITVDVEQCIYHLCDADNKPVATPGTTSIVLTGTHLCLRYIDKKTRTWNKTHSYEYQGKQVLRKKGDSVGQLGKGLLDLYNEHPQFFDQLDEAGIQIYQQPAAFEDSIITCWKVEFQGVLYPVSIALRDLFGGALTAEAREAMSAVGQITSWIMGKMTASLQVTDTDVAMRMKAMTRAAHDRLRLELIKLAAAEDTRQIFRCGTYEILRILLETGTKIKMMRKTHSFEL